jgi:hypothetical protein
MRWRRWIAISVAVIALGASSFFAYRAYSRHRDLAETLQWMEQTYNPHEGGENLGLGHGDETHYLENSTLHTEEVTEEFRQTLAYKGGCMIVIHDETVPIGVYKTVYGSGDYTLSLCDVDPESIKITTYDFHKDVGGCADPEQVQLFGLDCTSAEIVFHMRNDMPKIKDDSVTIYAELTGTNHELQSHNLMSKGWFIVDDVTYAQRFAKALKHAVELCGGKASKF